jgi:translation initiation factor IF-3
LPLPAFFKMNYLTRNHTVLSRVTSLITTFHFLSWLLHQLLFPVDCVRYLLHKHHLSQTIVIKQFQNTQTNKPPKARIYNILKMNCRPVGASRIGGPSALLLVLATTFSVVAVVQGFVPRIGLSSLQQISIPEQQQLSPTSSALFMARRNMNMMRRAPVKEKKPPMNDEIQFDELRVTTPNAKGKDEALGVMTKAEALAKAKEMGGLDVILLNPNSDPPVAKIVDYSKYRYMKEKKAKEVKKNSKATEVKEVKMSYKIDVHDYEVRKKAALKFLNQGNRVKCSIAFRGREIQHDKLGFELLDKLAMEMEDTCVREGRPKREGRNLSLIFTPRPEVVKQVGADRRASDKEKKKKREERLKEKKAVSEELAAAGIIADAEADDEDGSSSDSSMSNSSDDLLDLEADIESSLDDLFGSDDLTDDLFS